MQIKLFFFVLMSLFLFSSCKEDSVHELKPASTPVVLTPEPSPNPTPNPDPNPNPNPNPNPDPEPGPIDESHYITFTTTKSAGDIICLKIEVAEADKKNAWIDLNNNGKKDGGEGIVFSTHKEYTIGSKTIKLYGKINNFYCRTNELTELDVSKNAALEYLDCTSNLLNNLDLSQNTSLKSLACDRNLFNELDLSNNTFLESLGCRYNRLKKLNLSQNTALKSLACDQNLFTALDLSKNIVLDWVDCQSNKYLVNLNVKGALALSWLRCSGGKLESLDLSENKNLCYLNCSANKLGTLDITNNKKLETLHCEYNGLYSFKVDAKKNQVLKNLKIYHNNIGTKEMQKLVDGMRKCDKSQQGSFVVYVGAEEGNKITKEQVKTLKNKNWSVGKALGGDYEGY